MDGLKNLAELLSQYDWREVVEIGIGTAIGAGHAFYDCAKGSERKSSASLTGVITAFTAAFDPIQPMDSFCRSFGNGLLGGASYIASYHAISKILNALSA
jgi:hypothetical protein